MVAYFRLELIDQPGVYIKHNGVNAKVGVDSRNTYSSCFRAIPFIWIISAVNDTLYVYQDLDDKLLYYGSQPFSKYNPKYFMKIY